MSHLESKKKWKLKKGKNFKFAKIVNEISVDVNLGIKHIDDELENDSKVNFNQNLIRTINEIWDQSIIIFTWCIS